MLHAACFLLFLSGCGDFNPGSQDDPANGNGGGGGTANLATQLSQLRNNAQSGGEYVIEIRGDANISPAEAALPTGLSDVTITLRGVGVMREVRLSANGVLFTVGSGITLVLDENVTLVGRRPGGNGNANNNSHLVRVNDGGTLVMNTGSRITGNTNTNGGINAGGGVRVNSGGIFTMNGGEISDNVTTNALVGADTSGGGVRVESGGRFDMRDGTISGNSAVNRDGGGVYVVFGGTFNMFNGTISGNSARNGGGVFNAGTFRIFNGIIHGNNAAEGLRNTSTGTSASINIANNGTALAGTFNPAGEFSRLDTLATVNVTIHVVNGVLQIDRDGDGVVIVPGVTLADQFTWLRGSSRSGGSYVIELRGNANISPAEAALPTGLSDVTITLRGVGVMREVRLSASDTLFTVGSGITLVIDENVTLVGRKPGGNGNANNNNHLVRVNDGGTLVMNAGSRITDNTNTTITSANMGGGVRVNSGGIFTMNGGEISDNVTTTTLVGGDSSGGGVRVESGGRFDMRGGMISGNRTNRDGGGVYVVFGGTFNMFSGTISGNSARNGGGVFNAGTWRVDNGIIYGNNAMEELRNTSTGTSASINIANNGTALAGTFNPAGEFNRLDTLATVNVTIHVVNGVLQVDRDGDGVIIAPGITLADQLAWLRGFARNNGEYRVELNAIANISPAEAALPMGLSNVTITLRGIGVMREVRLSANGVLFTVGNGITLVLDENITLVGRRLGGNGNANNNNHLVRINDGGNLVMNAGARVMDNTNTATGANTAGGVRVNSGGIFTMNGGTISGNTTTASGFSDGDGGGVRVEFNGIFNMRGGAISGNSSGRDGGGVFNLGTFRISGGIVYGSNAAEGIRNTAGRNGAALFNGSTGVAQRGTFNNGTFTPSGALSTTNNTIE
jgi:ribosomal protein S11